MNTKNLIAISAFAASLCFAAEEASTEAAEVAAPSAVETCSASLDAAAKDIPANAVSAKYSLAAAKAARQGLGADPEDVGADALLQEDLLHFHEGGAGGTVRAGASVDEFNMHGIPPWCLGQKTLRRGPGFDKVQ